MEVKEIISTALRKHAIVWKKHALQRLLERGIKRQEVLLTIEQGIIIKEYAEDKPFPSFLIYNDNPSYPLHVVFAINKEEPEIFIITIYRSDHNIFSEDFKTRRTK